MAMRWYLAFCLAFCLFIIHRDTYNQVRTDLDGIGMTREDREGCERIFLCRRIGSLCVAVFFGAGAIYVAARGGSGGTIGAFAGTAVASICWIVFAEYCKNNSQTNASPSPLPSRPSYQAI